VLESSSGLEVVEISCPALHETFADHDLALPNERIDRERLFGGQRFVRHVAAHSPWAAFAGGEAQETGIGDATGGLAAVRVVRPANGSAIAFSPHDGELVFGFVASGSAVLQFDGSQQLAASDAFVVPPAAAWSLDDPSNDLRLLHVTTARIGEGLAARRSSPL